MSDEQYITYTIFPLGDGRWFVDNTSGTSGFSFPSLAEAERFAITLAKRNTPSKVRLSGQSGEVIDEKVFDQPTDAGK